MATATTKFIQPKVATQIAEPPIARFLFADTRMAWLWLIVRLYIGYQWITAGFDKLTGHSIAIGSFGQSTGAAWVFNAHQGAAMKGFAQGALALANGAHPSVQSWYASFLSTVVIPNATLFAYIITFGEILVGLGLIFGFLTGIAAFFGLAMNLNFLLTGTISISPVIGTLALLLVLARRIAGYYGVDRYLLPLLGTPWTGSLTHKEVAHVPEEVTQIPTPAFRASQTQLALGQDILDTYLQSALADAFYCHAYTSFQQLAHQAA